MPTQVRELGIDRVPVEATLRRQNERLRILSEALGRLLTNDDPEAMVADLFATVSEHLDLDAYFNFMVTEAGDALRLDSCAGIPAETARDIDRLEFGQAVCGTVALQRAAMVATDIQRSDDPRVALVKGFGIRAYACHPLIAGGRLLGTLSFASRRRDRFTDDELEFLRTICHYVALAKERARLLREATARAARLAESEERFRTMADSAPVLIWVNGPGGCEFVNRAYRDFLGVTPEQTLCMDWAAAVHPDDRAAYVGAYLRAFAAREPFTAQFRFRRADGEYRWFQSVGQPRYAEAGDFVGYIGVSADVTEMKRAEQGLKEADRRKDEFLAMLAHELRNPLAAISHAVTLLARAGAPAADAWPVEAITRQLRHLTGLIDDLLDVSRITRGKVRLHRHRIEVGPVLKGALEAVAPLVAERGHTLAVAQDPGLWLVADPMRIEQVLVNLLTNAAKYTEAGGRIELSATRAADQVVLAVRDNGMGIPAEQLPAMFELFAQGERSLARSEGGLGIGLTIVRSLVELHGGRVTARSAGVGQGSEFVVRLPAAGPPAPAPAVAVPRRGPRGGSRRYRVLIVDDNIDLAGGLARLLTLVGHEVRTARDGTTALEAAQAFHPEVVLLDIGLPGMDGYEVARRFRADGLAHAVILAVSGYGEELARRRSREAGCDDHLVKPVEFDTLLAVLDGLRTER